MKIKHKKQFRTMMTTEPKNMKIHPIELPRPNLGECLIIRMYARHDDVQRELDVNIT